jgi:hypothetical protein
MAKALRNVAPRRERGSGEPRDVLPPLLPG